MFTYYLMTLALTLILEFLVYFLFSFKDKTALLTLLGLNLITHPLLALYLFIGSTVFELSLFFSEILVLELVIVFLESFILFYIYKNKHSYSKLLMLSLSANSASFLFGLVAL